MLDWLRNNVIADKMHNMASSGCILVARWMLAAIVVMAAAAVTCGCARTKPPALLPRETVHAALYSAVWGVKILKHECEEAAMDAVKAGDAQHALWLAQSCDEHTDAAGDELVPALEEMHLYGPNSIKTVGCKLSGTLGAYASIRPAMERLGRYSIDAEDGEANVRWLISQAGSCK